MKTRILLTTALAVVALGAVGLSQSAWAANDDGDISATIVQPVTITAVDPLDFGNIAAGAGVDTVIIAPVTGARTKGGGDAVLVGGGTEQDGTFDLDGADGLTVNIDVPANATVTSGLNTMSVDTFAWNFNGTTTTGDGTVALPVGGPATLSVGATLHVGAAQAAGTYIGTYNVEVLYQ